MHRYASTFLVITALLLPGQLNGQQAAPDSTAARLQPGDVLRLAIWREEDLSGDFEVDEHGTAVLPKLGPMKVNTADPELLRAQILQDYGRYLRNPSIKVTFLRRFTVLGAVMKPGVYSVDPTMAVADALAMAGGAAPDGRKDRGEVRRGGVRIATQLSDATRIADSPIRSGDELYVPERSWVSRNTALVTTAISVAASLLIAFRH